jgi:glycosyltransferase involved in cell wall biosynthesis
MAGWLVRPQETNAPSCHRAGRRHVTPRRLFIADPGLTGALGHHLGYSAAVARAARDEGITPIVLAGRGFEGTIAEGEVTVRQAFGTRYQSAGGGGPLRRLLYGALSGLPAGAARRAAEALRVARRGLAGARVDGFGAELAAALAADGATAEDAVLLHSVSAANLAGLPAALAPRLLVVLRRTPEDMDRDDAAPEPILALLARLHAAPGLRLSLFADTEGLAALFAQGTGLAVHPVPIPVVVRPGARPAPDGLPHVVFAGGARAEKGYAALPEAIEAVAGRARFTLQSGPVDAASDPLVQRAHRRLRGMAGAQVRLLETALEPEAYAALLASADLLLLPYDPAAYGPRSSGILAEALALGIPAVVPGGCWMAEAAGPERAVIIQPGQPVGAALAQALDRLAALRAAAEAGSGPWRAHHAPGALLHALLRGFVSPPG